MVKHIILWQLNYTDEAEKNKISADIKEGLEGLAGKIPGLISIKVNLNPLESSNADVMLDCTLESEEALKNYAVNPLHVKVANEKVRPFTKQRVCIDFEE